MGSDALFWSADVHADKTSIDINKSLKTIATKVFLFEVGSELAYKKLLQKGIPSSFILCCFPFTSVQCLEHTKHRIHLKRVNIFHETVRTSVWFQNTSGRSHPPVTPTTENLSPLPDSAGAHTHMHSQAPQVPYP